jgi:proline iminopeptidase
MASVTLADGVSLNVEERGGGYPLMLLHGGPGLDHHEFRPWLDPLADRGFRLLFVDMRGQGLSERVDPETLTISGFARDVDALAQALDLAEFAVLGHSFGAIVALCHALEHGTATHYVISSGAASAERLMEDVEREIDRFEPASMRDQIRRSWDDERTVETVAQARSLMESQLPFHFMEMGDAYRAYAERDETVYSPEVLRYFASQGYGGFDWLDHLRWISKPMLVIAGRHDRTCTVERSEEIAREVAGSKLVVIERAAHMTFVEQPTTYIKAVHTWFVEQGVLPDPAAAQEAAS